MRKALSSLILGLAGITASCSSSGPISHERVRDIEDQTIIYKKDFRLPANKAVVFTYEAHNDGRTVLTNTLSNGELGLRLTHKKEGDGDYRSIEWIGDFGVERKYEHCTTKEGYERLTLRDFNKQEVLVDKNSDYGSVAYQRELHGLTYWTNHTGLWEKVRETEKKNRKRD